MNAGSEQPRNRPSERINDRASTYRKFICEMNESWCVCVCYKYRAHEQHIIMWWRWVMFLWFASALFFSLHIFLLSYDASSKWFLGHRHFSFCHISTHLENPTRRPKTETHLRWPYEFCIFSCPLLLAQRNSPLVDCCFILISGHNNNNDIKNIIYEWSPKTLTDLVCHGRVCVQPQQPQWNAFGKNEGSNLMRSTNFSTVLFCFIFFCCLFGSFDMFIVICKNCNFSSLCHKFTSQCAWHFELAQIDSKTVCVTRVFAVLLVFYLLCALLTDGIRYACIAFVVVSVMVSYQ